MDRKLRNRTLLFLALAAVVAFALVRLSGRQPVAKISATTPVRQNIVSSVSSNGKVEPISPYTIRAELHSSPQQKRGSSAPRMSCVRRRRAGGPMKRHGSTGTSRKLRRNWIGDNAIMIRSNAC